MTCLGTMTLLKQASRRRLSKCEILQARAASVGQVMYGTYRIPSSSDQPIDIVINPTGNEIRSVKR